jgi:hypothetical protein
VNTSAEGNNIPFGQSIEGSLVMNNGLIGEDALPESKRYQLFCQRNNRRAGRIPESPGPLAPDETKGRSILSGHGSKGAAYFFNELFHDDIEVRPDYDWPAINLENIPANKLRSGRR